MNRLFIYIIISCFYFSNIYSEEIAIVTKNNGDVKYKKNSSQVFKNRVNPGFELYKNDLLVTGDNGFVMFAYLDDGSLVKVHKNSGVYVNGNIFDNSIQKQINVDDGFLKFEIKKQKENEFKIVTPTSVASVKGTTFFLDANLNQDGSLNIENITQEDLVFINQIQLDSGVELEEIQEEDDGTGSLDDQTNTYQIILQFSNSEGDVKNLIINLSDK